MVADIDQSSYPQGLPDHIKALADKCKPKHVRVVQAIVSGQFSSNTKAYQSVYRKASGDTARANVAAMLARTSVSALYNALRDLQLLAGVLARDEALLILSDIAQAHIGDVVEFSDAAAVEDDDGEPIIRASLVFRNSADLSKATLRSISEVSTTRDGLRIKQHDRLAAIRQLALMLGWNEPDKATVPFGTSVYLEQVSQSLYGKNPNHKERSCE